MADWTSLKPGTKVLEFTTGQLLTIVEISIHAELSQIPSGNYIVWVYAVSDIGDDIVSKVEEFVQSVIRVE